MKRSALVLAGMILCSASAFAQEPQPPQQVDQRLAGPPTMPVTRPQSQVDPRIAPQPQIDPRLVGPMVAAMQANAKLADPALNARQADIAVREAKIKIMTEDAEKREADLAEWFKGWFGEKPAEPAK